MVVLTLTTDSSDHTVRFREPLYKFQLSCSQYNSWHNLSRSGEISIFDYQVKAGVKKFLKVTIHSIALV